LPFLGGLHDTITVRSEALIIPNWWLMLYFLPVFLLYIRSRFASENQCRSLRVRDIGRSVDPSVSACNHARYVLLGCWFESTPVETPLQMSYWAAP
jgi:hypothetical protein